MDDLKKLGYHGVILGYAKEVVVDHEEGKQAPQIENIGNDKTGNAVQEVEAWKKGTLATLQLAEDGDMIALKFTGAGSEAMQRLSQCLPPSPILEKAIVEICDLAKERNVNLLFDAEQQAVQGGIDAWTMDYQRLYNKQAPGKALVYGTYQAYLRSTPATLAKHLATAKAEGFTLGVKLVRGAYLGSDPRHLIWPKKEDTDRAYNGIAESLIIRRYGEVLSAVHGSEGESFPNVSLVMASHNQETVQRATKLRNLQTQRGEPKIDMYYGQLMGMADEVSCELVQARRAALGQSEKGSADLDAARPFKYITWGTVGECLKYLVRRAQENRDAFDRTSAGKRAMGQELSRRFWGMLGR